MSLSAAITQLVTVAGNVSGVVRAYSDPPESISEFPAALVYANNGTLEGISNGLSRNLHTIRIDVLSSRQQLPQAVNEAKAWPDSLQARLRADETLSGTVSGIVWPVAYEAIALQYNNLTHYGMRFAVTVKIMEAV